MICCKFLLFARRKGAKDYVETCSSERGKEDYFVDGLLEFCIDLFAERKFEWIEWVQAAEQGWQSFHFRQFRAPICPRIPAPFESERVNFCACFGFASDTGKQKRDWIASLKNIAIPGESFQKFRSASSSSLDKEMCQQKSIQTNSNSGLFQDKGVDGCLLVNGFGTCLQREHFHCLFWSKQKRRERNFPIEMELTRTQLVNGKGMDWVWSIRITWFSPAATAEWSSFWPHSQEASERNLESISMFFNRLNSIRSLIHSFIGQNESVDLAWCHSTDLNKRMDGIVLLRFTTQTTNNERNWQNPLRLRLLRTNFGWNESSSKLIFEARPEPSQSQPQTNACDE